MLYRGPKARRKTRSGGRRVEAIPIELAGSKCAAGADSASVLGPMAQHDNRICTQFLRPASGKRDNASMPYRSGRGVEIADHVIRSRWIAKISWDYVPFVLSH